MPRGVRSRTRLNPLRRFVAGSRGAVCTPSPEVPRTVAIARAVPLLFAVALFVAAVAPAYAGDVAVLATDPNDDWDIIMGNAGSAAINPDLDIMHRFMGQAGRGL